MPGRCKEVEELVHSEKVVIPNIQPIKADKVFDDFDVFHKLYPQIGSLRLSTQGCLYFLYILVQQYNNRVTYLNEPESICPEGFLEDLLSYTTLMKCIMFLTKKNLK